MRELKAGALYFALAFGAGFVLGTFRTLVLVPRVGERAAELIEAPVMLVVTVLAAKGVVRRLEVPAALSKRITVGLTGLALLVAAEASFVVLLRHMTLADYVRGKDPVSGTVYLLLLGAFAVMPALVRG